MGCVNKQMADYRPNMANPQTPDLVRTPTGDGDDNGVGGFETTSFGFRTPPPRSHVRAAEKPRSAVPSPLPSPSPLVLFSPPRGADDVLPQHCCKAPTPPLTPVARVGLTIRRIGSTLSSPFLSPPTKKTRRRIGGYGAAKVGCGEGGSRGGDGPHRAHLLLAAAAAVALICGGLWYHIRSIGRRPCPAPAAPAAGRGAAEPFRFRPPPVPGTPSDTAASLYREAYKSRDGGYIGYDDPENPGPAFVLMDLAGGEGDDGGGSFIDEAGTVYKTAREFALGYGDYLSDEIAELWGRENAAARGGEGEEGAASGRPDMMVEVTSLYSLASAGLPHVGEAHYASPDGRTALIEIKFAVPSPESGADSEEVSEVVRDYVAGVLKAIRRYGETKAPENVRLGYTGLPFFQADLDASSPGGETRGKLSAVEDILPPTAPSMVTYDHMAEVFGWGRISPYRVIFDGRAADKGVDNEEGFKVMHRVMGALAEVDVRVDNEEEEMEEQFEMMSGIAAVNLDSIPQRIEDGHMFKHLQEVMDELFGTRGAPQDEGDAAPPAGGIRGRPPKPYKRTTYDGVAYLRNNPVPFPVYLGAALCTKKNKPRCPIEFLHLFMHMTVRATSQDRKTTYVTATLGVDPYSDDGIAWLQAVRAKLRELEDSDAEALGGYRVFIEGGASSEYDAMRGAQGTSHDLPTTMLMFGLGMALVGLVLLLFALSPLSGGRAFGTRQNVTLFRGSVFCVLVS